MSQFKPFHLAFPIRDIAETKAFYGELLGCEIGRSTDKWIDFNFFGHQLSAHVKPEELTLAHSNTVDGKYVPVRHFGAILAWEEWHELADKLKNHGIEFVIEPYIRFQGEVGEQATMFFLDPCGNALEFKSFQDETQIFAN
ncbi:extradiol dioxygenase family protein [Algoriphagus sp. 4150]|uniref:VOC family protein n=1 Tax=Algoriphagus sp. 4150 TaxID=2817756 RepID=UPI00285D10B9|nr:VOC family protein [Algoriphagus sp. 4150]MDR7128531.1 extradiol dioxygenase family protein [Algoriphagus sp. 4150]